METFHHVPASTLRFGGMLLRARRHLALGDTTCTVPADDAALVFQALHHRHCSHSTTLGRLVWALGLLREGRVEPDALIARMRAADASALTGYLASLGHVHQELFGSALPDDELRARLTADDLRPRAQTRRPHADA